MVEWEEFFRPNFAKILWFMAFFIMGFEALWIQTICIKASCQAWYFRLAFWIFSWPFALKSILPLHNPIQVMFATVFFIFVPFFYYYFLSCFIAHLLPIRRRH